MSYESNQSDFSRELNMAQFLYDSGESLVVTITICKIKTYNQSLSFLISI